MSDGDRRKCEMELTIMNLTINQLFCMLMFNQSLPHFAGPIYMSFFFKKEIKEFDHAYRFRLSRRFMSFK